MGLTIASDPRKNALVLVVAINCCWNQKYKIIATVAFYSAKCDCFLCVEIMEFAITQIVSRCRRSHSPTFHHAIPDLETTNQFPNTVFNKPTRNILIERSPTKFSGPFANDLRSRSPWILWFWRAENRFVAPNFNVGTIVRSRLFLLQQWWRWTHIETAAQLNARSQHIFFWFNSIAV